MGDKHCRLLQGQQTGACLAQPPDPGMQVHLFGAQRAGQRPWLPLPPWLLPRPPLPRSLRLWQRAVNRDTQAAERHRDTSGLSLRGSAATSSADQASFKTSVSFRDAHRPGALRGRPQGTGRQLAEAAPAALRPVSHGAGLYSLPAPRVSTPRSSAWRISEPVNVQHAR